ncbi:MFS transporter [Paenibacillus phocaensis]|uniref:MFS transporter n=1 Tax=Paenibacillus phocaensis TaxID=1776378 RepID=UPI000B1A6BC3|nr:MFS transporter [Paenibacillus phocaensis]
MKTKMDRPPWVHHNYALIRSLLFGAALLILSSLYVTVPLLPEFARVFSVSTSESALAGSAFSLFFAAGCLVYGPLSNRLGRKRMIVAGLAVLVVSTACLGYAASFGALILLRCLQGAAAATFSPVALTYAGEIFPPDQRVTAIGFVSSGFLMAGIFGQVWASSLAAFLGWPWVFRLLALAYLLTLLLLIVWLPPVPAGQAREGRSGKGRRGAAVLANPSLWFCYGITLTILLCFVGMYSALGSFLGNPPYSLGEMEILGVRSLGMLGMVLSLFAGRICRKWGLLPVLRTGLILSLAALLLMSFVQELGVYLVMSVLFVAGIAVVVPSLISLIGEIGSGNRGVATSLYTFVLFAGASVGPILTAYLLETGRNALPFQVFAGILSFALLCSIFIRYRRN